MSLDKGGEGDLADRFWQSLKSAAEKESGKAPGEIKKEDELLVEWPVALIMVHKV